MNGPNPSQRLIPCVQRVLDSGIDGWRTVSIHFYISCTSSISAIWGFNKTKPHYQHEEQRLSWWVSLDFPPILVSLALL